MAKKKKIRPVWVNETWVPIPERYTLTHNENEDTQADITGLRANASKDDRYSTAHEIGHLFLETSIGDRERERIRRILKVDGPWDQGTGLEGGYSSPSEIAADYYAAAATGYPHPGKDVSGYARIGPKRLRRFKKYLDHVGKERGLRQYGSDGLTDYGEL